MNSPTSVNFPSGVPKPIDSWSSADLHLSPGAAAFAFCNDSGRSQRPARLLLVLRGLPGSGKSHLAKKIKEVEVEQGGQAPRIHSIDDYFMTVSGPCG